MKSLSLLFPNKFESTKTSLILLASRLVFGLTFASHGLEKLQHFTETAAHFPAPFGLSGDVAVGLSIFGELFCGLAFCIRIPYPSDSVTNDFHDDSSLYYGSWWLGQCWRIGFLVPRNLYSFLVRRCW